MIYSKICVEHLEQLCGLLLRLLEASIAEPCLLFHPVVLAFWAELRGSSLSRCAAGFAFPAVMVRLAWCVEMVCVNIEDQVGACPSFLLHRCRGFAIVGS